MSSELLQQAYRLIREGNKPEAVRLLTPLVRAEPLNADAWWLLANALDNPEQKRKALEQVLKLRPNDDAAKRMYDRLQPSSAPLKKQTVKTKRVEVAEPVGMSSPSFEEVEGDEDIFESYDPMLDDRPVTSTRGSGARRSSGGGRGPIATCLAIIGALTVISCIGCLAITAFSLPRVGDAFQSFMLTVTYDPNMSSFADQMNTLGAPGLMETLNAVLPGGATQAAPQGAATLPAPQSGASMPDDLVGRGTISKGQTVSQTLDSAREDAWTFSADAGETVLIELTANGGDLDTQLYLYDGNRRLIAENDDIESGNTNSRIAITLTDAGKYTIRVGRFTGGGEYLLKLS